MAKHQIAVREDPRIERERLNTLLHKALKRRLVVLNAPTGYGKTIVLAKATAKLSHTVIWFSAGSSERTLQDVLSLLHTQLPFPPAESSAESTEPRSPRDEARRFLHVMHETVPDGALLVIDAIERSPVAGEVLSLIQGILDHGASPFHLAITAEGELDLRVTELARKRELAILGKEQLAFTREEIVEFFRSVWHNDPGDELIDEVMEITGGWPRGIQAIGSAFAQMPQSRSAVRESDLFSTFVPPDAEVQLPHLEEMDRQLLLAVAFLPAFTRRDADYLAGVHGAGDRLLALCKTRPWLTTHSRERLTVDPAVRAQLLATIDTEWPPQKLRTHKRQVAQLLEQRREFAAALNMFADAKDAEGVNRMLGRLGAKWFLNRDPSEFLALARKLEQFSNMGIEGRLACALVADAEGDYARSYHHCQDVLQSAPDQADHTPFLILQGRARARMGDERQEKEMVTDAIEEPIATIDNSVMTSYLAAEEVRRGAFKAADSRLRRSLSRAEDPQSEYALDLAAVRRADLQVRMGRYQTALASLRKSSLGTSRRNTFLAMRHQYLLAELLGYRGEFAEAVSSASTALDLAVQFAFDLPRQYALLLLSDLAIWQGDLERARTWFGEAESLIHPSLQTDDARQVFETTRGRLAWATGVVEEARRAFESARNMRSGNRFSGLWNLLAVIHAQLRILEDETVGEELEWILAEAEQLDSLHIQANALLLAAYNQVSQNSEKFARDLLARFWGVVDLHGFRFMPASDAEVVLWAERSRAEYDPEGTARAVRLIAPSLPAASVARQAVVEARATRPLVEIDTFGPLTVAVRGERRDEIWKSRLKAKRFLEILLSADGQRTTADEAAEYLWPTASPDRIRHRLHNEVSNLRKIFTSLDVQGHVEVRYEHSFYRLYSSDQVWVTHLVFQSLVERAKATSEDGDSTTAVKLYREAVEYYTGVFLKDAQYERFADTIRQHLADLYAGCLHALAEAPDTDDAGTLAWWQKAIEHDPFDEDAYRSAIDVSIRMGQKSRALKYLSMLEEHLVGELELPLPKWAEEFAEQLAKRL
jgi:ATP/maltotriose-dependent transcriptional regulator MalT/DNA-binding SARP family transcriptional activator